MLVRFNHVVQFIVNADHSILRAAAVLGIADCIPDCVRFAIPQATEWQSIENQLDAAMIFARADFINVLVAI